MFDLVCANGSQEPSRVIHIAVCAVALQSNMICDSTSRYVLATYRTTCAAYCNCCWLIM